MSMESLERKLIEQAIKEHLHITNPKSIEKVIEKIMSNSEIKVNSKCKSKFIVSKNIFVGL